MGKMNLRFTFLIVAALAGQVSAATYYVSSSAGSDANTPAQAQNQATPWATIARVNAQSFLPGDSILFKRGDTWTNETITVNSSGSSGSPITYGAYGAGNKPLISGFTAISGWTNAGGGVYSKTISTESAPNMVTVDSVNTPIGRWPDTGWLTFEAHAGNTSITDNELAGTPNWTGAEVIIRKNHWVIDRNPITLHSGNTITYTSASGYSGINGFGYFIQNNLQTLDQIGEWYCGAGKIYMYFGGGGPGARSVKVSTKDFLVSVSNRDYVNFDNLAFEGANARAISLASSDYVGIRNCSIDFSGTNAIQGTGTANYVTIENNTINHTNNTGIQLSANYNYTSIKSNTIQNTALIAGMNKSSDGEGYGMGLVVPNSVIELNTVENSGYIGINFTGSNVEVKNNYVNNFCSVRDDGGGIYTYRYSTSTPHNFNRKVFNNIVSNGIGAPGGTTSAEGSANGLYTDGVSDNVEVYNNTSFNNSSSGMHINSNDGGSVHHNTFYNNRRQLDMMVLAQGNGGDKNISINNNIFFAKEPSQYTLIYVNHYEPGMDPTMSSDQNYFIRPLGNGRSITMDQSAGEQAYDLARWQTDYNRDLTSHALQATITPYTINSLIGSNKFSNGSFTTDISGAGCWNDAGNCARTWHSNKLDGGTLQVSFNASVPTSDSSLTFPVGAVASGKNYILRYTVLGTTNNHRTFNVYLRKYTTPHIILSQVSSTELSTSRTENEVLFTSPMDQADAAVTFLINRADSTNNTVWFDNVQLYEADVAMTNPDDHILFDYNATLTPKVVPLSQPMVDVAGVKYTGSVTIQPYSSVVLMVDASPDVTPPSLTGFIIPAAAASLTVPVTVLTATDNVAVTGYTLTESAVAPSTTSGTWSVSAPANYTFGSAGAKTLYAWAKDAAGNVSTSLNDSVVIDTTPPTVSVTAPTAGATVSATYSVTGTASDAVGVSGVQFKLDGTNLGAEDTVAPYAYSWATTGASNGSHSLTAVARDAAGNTSTSPAVSFSVSNAVVDVSSPTVTAFTIPASSRSLTIGITAFTATDNTGVAGYLVNESATRPLPGAGGWAATAQTSYTFASSGAKTLYAWAKDAAGNVSTSLNDSVVIDTTPPTVSVTAPTAGATVSATYSVTGTASDAVGVSGVQFKLDGTNLGAEDTVAPYAYSWATTGASNGSHSLTAVARDAAGNTSTSSAVSFSVSNAVVDASSPTVTAFTIPASAGSLTVSITAFTATDNTSVTGYLVNESATRPLPGAGGWAATAQTGYTFASSGAKTLYAWAKDAAGNVSTSLTDTVSIALASPSVTIISPVDGQTIDKTLPVTVSGAAAGALVTRVELWADGVLSDLHVFPGGTASFNGSLLSWRTTTGGAHFLQAKAYDALGQYGSSALISVNAPAKSLVALVGYNGSQQQDVTGGPGSPEPRALVLSNKAGQQQNLVFAAEVQEVSLLNLSGRVLKKMSNQGSGIVFSLQGADESGIKMPSGLLLIQMKDSAGKYTVKPLMVVK